MKSLYSYIAGIVLLAVIGIYSCKYKHYINHHFRTAYEGFEGIRDSDSTQLPFFKIHFVNGDVCLMEDWALNADKSQVGGQGHLYDFNRRQIREGTMWFPLHEIAIIETNQLAAIKSRDQARVASLAVLTGLNLILDIFCITNPKACFGSCPTFYTEGQTAFHSANAEGFSSAIAPSLEEADIDALGYRTSAPGFSLSMKNEALETHMVNQLQAVAVPKAVDENVFQDRAGIFYRCGELESCQSAKVEDKDIRDVIKQMDEHEYFSSSDSFNLAIKESIILEFKRPPGERLGLAVQFRQTLLTTFLFYSALSYMGEEVGACFSQLETSKWARELMQEPVKRLGGIQLSAWNESTQSWQLFDELNETGPIARNVELAAIPTTLPKGKTLKVKMELTKGLWRLGYVGLTAIHAEVKPHIASPACIEVLDGEGYTIKDVQYDDDDYLVAFPGNEFRFTFLLPEIEHGREYEMFVLSKGYYLEWMRQEWMEEKNLSKLWKMLRNDPATWRSLAVEFKQMEEEMEAVFWGSKFAEMQ